MLARISQIAFLLVALSLLVACRTSQDSEYLAEEIPPCTPVEGATVDPCEPDSLAYLISPVDYAPPSGGSPLSMRELFKDPLGLVAHVALRGTYLPNTLRCTHGNPYRLPSYSKYEEPTELVQLLSINCYVDVRVGAYVLGNGPPSLTVKRYHFKYHEGYFAQIAEGEGKTEEEYIEDFRQLLETDEYIGGIEGREEVLFLGPDATTSTDVWEAIVIWDVQRREDGTVIAVHPERDLWRRFRPDDYQTHRSVLELELPVFTQAVTMARQERVTEYGGRIGADPSLPMLVTDASQLRQYFISVGAYDHPDGPPAQPPPTQAP